MTYVITILICLVFGGFFLFLAHKCNDETIETVLKVIALLFGLVACASLCGGLIRAAYEEGQASVIRVQERNELMEKQEQLISELGITPEQLEILKR